MIYLLRKFGSWFYGASGTLFDFDKRHRSLLRNRKVHNWDSFVFSHR